MDLANPTQGRDGMQEYEWRAPLAADPQMTLRADRAANALERKGPVFRNHDGKAVVYSELDWDLRCGLLMFFTRPIGDKNELLRDMPKGKWSDYEPSEGLGSSGSAPGETAVGFDLAAGGGEGSGTLAVDRSAMTTSPDAAAATTKSPDLSAELTDNMVEREGSVPTRVGLGITEANTSLSLTDAQPNNIRVSDSTPQHDSVPSSV